MFKKTTSANYFKYGKVTDVHKQGLEDFDVYQKTITNKEVRTLQSFDHPVYIEPREGMAMLRIVENPSIDNIESFAIHRGIKINENNYFAIVPMDESTTYNLYVKKHTKSKTYTLPQPFAYKQIKPSIHIQEILAYYYVVKRPAYYFYGETHPYYELTYVDQGELQTTVDGKTFTIHKNECFYYGPNQFHDQKVTSEASCSYLTIIFKADGINDALTLNKVFKCSRGMVQAMESFVKTSETNHPYGFDAMISYLQTFIVDCMISTSKQSNPSPTSPINQYFENKLMEEIIEYINHHLYEPLAIDTICEKFSISRSTLQNLFKNNLQTAPKKYINEAKLNHSKILIRKGDRTISEIAIMLGFNSIHYFSRKFTNRYGFTPSEYSRRIYDESDIKIQNQK